MSAEAITPTKSVAANAFKYALIILAIAFAMALAIFLAGTVIHASNADQAEKRAIFEKVLNMSSAELDAKSVQELNGYRQDIERAGHYNVYLGNITATTRPS
jgi:hypothetical protein